MKRNLYNTPISRFLCFLPAAVAVLAVICGTIVFSPAFSMRAMAAEEETDEQPWSEEYYRASDVSGQLTDAERDNLDTDEAVILAFGNASDLVPESYLDHIEESVPQFRDKYGIFGPFYATIRHMLNYVEQDHSGQEDETDQETAAQEAEDAVDADIEDKTSDSEDQSEADPSARVGEGSDKPAWYPVHPDSFPKYHDDAASRVVDVADLFTDEEEAQMESRLAQVRSELQKDIVIFTDISAYGLGHDIYSADFYDFNGYGVGGEYEGAVLFICMDPGDRGWWTCCTGPDSRAAYTEEAANQIDDLLYEYMSDGEYYAGVTDWIENMRRLFRNGSPYLDDWVSQDLSSFERFHSEDSPRVIDSIGLFSESELSSITEKAKELSSKYDIDVVVHTALSPGTMSSEEYAEKYYYFGGYGFGDDYEGIMLSVFKRPGYMAYCEVTGYGQCAEKLTKTNSARLESRCGSKLESYEYCDAVSSWIDQTDHMMRTGRVPQSSFHWTFITILSLIAGSIYGGFSLMNAGRKMETPAIAENANAYYVKDSLKMRRVSDTFLDMRTSKVYSPRETRSSEGSSSSGGRSSYSSSYKGSSGTSHSGSGRRF